MSVRFTQLAYNSVDDFVYGLCPHPVTCKNGLVIGGGEINPEVNYTLPAMPATEEAFPEARQIYQKIITGVLDKALQLHASGLFAEFETLPQFTEHPEWGIEIHKVLRDTMYEYEAKYGLKSAIRITPNDLREMVRPPVMRGNKYWDAMVRVFEQTARDGAGILAIESTGGKEVNDQAIVNADIRTSVFALGCLAPRNMKWLWTNIVDIAQRNGAIPGSDSACGFANTAMVLAGQGFIPKVYAAVIRAMVTPRALVTLECGATGPSKDCAYENVYLKTITGTPIALEGKSADCAHFSPIGNIAAYAADLWSNESEQQVKLLSGFAPVVSTEQLIYDCRLMNKAAKKGHRKLMRDLLIESDCYLDPQAYILKPENVFEIAGEIVKTQDPFLRTLNTARVSLGNSPALRGQWRADPGGTGGALAGLLRTQLEDIPEDEEAFIAEMKEELDEGTYMPSEYGI